MFGLTWKKYLPVIAIMIKRSAKEEQTLSLNGTDFRRAAAGRKIRYSFSNLQLNNGRIKNSLTHSPLAVEFGQLLAEDMLTRNLVKGNQFEFSMNNDFQLRIKNVAAGLSEVPQEGATEEK
ncbi:MAG: hypothetical protein H7Y31_14685 [Chitinophagaceae bacterium]|nr:hypothetical protein [Chitinophagaceae bacterium]